jgi:ribosomal protein L32
MGKPKKQTSPRKSGLRRSHLVVKLARMVNAKSPVKAYTTKRESGKKKVAEAKPAAKKPAAKK